MPRSTSARPGKKKGEVALLFSKVALFENSNRGEGGADPFLSHCTTHTLHACRVSFVYPVQGSSFAMLENWKIILGQLQEKRKHKSYSSGFV